MEAPKLAISCMNIFIFVLDPKLLRPISIFEGLKNIQLQYESELIVSANVFTPKMNQGEKSVQQPRMTAVMHWKHLTFYEDITFETNYW